MPGASGRLRGTDGLKRAPAVLHRESGQGHVAATLSHLLQPPRSAAVQELRAAGREAQLRDRGDRRLRAGVSKTR